MDWGNESGSSTKTSSKGTGDGKIDYSKPVFLNKKKGMKLTFSLLDGYKEENKYTDKAGTPQHKQKYIAHSVEGFDRKIICAKQLRQYDEKKDGKPTGTKKWGYDSDNFGVPCDHCTEMIASKPSPKDLPTKSQKSISIYVPVIMWEAEYDIYKKNGSGDDTSTVVERFVEKPQVKTLLELPIGDFFFGSATSGVGKKLTSLFTNPSKPLEKAKIVWTYGELIKLTTINEEGDEVAVKLTKEEQKLLDSLRANIEEIWDEFKPLLPMTYAEYHKERYETEYVDPYEVKAEESKKFFAEKNAKDKAEGKTSKVEKKEPATVGAKASGKTVSKSNSTEEITESDIPPF